MRERGTAGTLLLEMQKLRPSRRLICFKKDLRREETLSAFIQLAMKEKKARSKQLM